MVMMMWQAHVFLPSVLDIPAFIMLPAWNKVNYRVSQYKLKFQEGKKMSDFKTIIPPFFWVPPLFRPTFSDSFSRYYSLTEITPDCNEFHLQFLWQQPRITARAFTLSFTSNSFFCSWNYSEDKNSEQCRLKGHRQFPVMSMVLTSCSWKESLTLYILGLCATLFWERTRQGLIDWRNFKTPIHIEILFHCYYIMCQAGKHMQNSNKF